VSVERPPSSYLRSRELGPLIRRFVARVESAGVRGTVTSWWRSSARNAAVGGVPSSLHLYGLAIDYVPPRSDWRLDEQTFRAAGLRVLNEGDHLHVSL
jgi:hypothetical protein